MAKWSQEKIAEHAAALEEKKLLLQRLGNEALADEYRAARKAKEALEELVKSTNFNIMAMELLFAERFAEADTRVMEFANGLKMRVSSECGYVFTNKLDFINFLKNAGHEHELTVHVGSLNRIIRESLAESGMDPNVPPPGTKFGEPMIKFTVTGL